MAAHGENDVKTATQDIVPAKVDSEAARTSAEWAAGDVDKVQLEDTNLDPALRATGGAIVQYSDEAFARVLRKIDSHMLPLMCWLYMIQFADKSSLNYSSLMGIKADNHLNGYQYSWLGSIFYAGYIFWEYANALDTLGCESLLTPSPPLLLAGFPQQSSSDDCLLASICPSTSSVGVPSWRATLPPRTGPAS